MEKIYDPVVKKIDGMNVLGLVVFSIFFGVIIGRMGTRGKPLIDLFDALCEATMKLVTLVIWYVEAMETYSPTPSKMKID